MRQAISISLLFVSISGGFYWEGGGGKTKETVEQWNDLNPGSSGMGLKDPRARFWQWARGVGLPQMWDLKKSPKNKHHANIGNHYGY